MHRPTRRLAALAGRLALAALAAATLAAAGCTNDVAKKDAKATTTTSKAAKKTTTPPDVGKVTTVGELRAALAAYGGPWETTDGLTTEDLEAYGADYPVTVNGNDTLVRFTQYAAASGDDGGSGIATGQAFYDSGSGRCYSGDGEEFTYAEVDLAEALGGDPAIDLDSALLWVLSDLDDDTPVTRDGDTLVVEGTSTQTGVPEGLFEVKMTASFELGAEGEVVGYTVGATTVAEGAEWENPYTVGGVVSYDPSYTVPATAAAEDTGDSVDENGDPITDGVPVLADECAMAFSATDLTTDEPSDMDPLLAPLAFGQVLAGPNYDTIPTAADLEALSGRWPGWSFTGPTTDPELGATLVDVTEKATGTQSCLAFLRVDVDSGAPVSVQLQPFEGSCADLGAQANETD